MLMGPPGLLRKDTLERWERSRRYVWEKEERMLTG
jgi:hypothetical protein